MFPGLTEGDLIPMLPVPFLFLPCVETNDLEDCQATLFLPHSSLGAGFEYPVTRLGTHNVERRLSSDLLGIMPLAYMPVATPRPNRTYFAIHGLPRLYLDMNQVRAQPFLASADTTLKHLYAELTPFIHVGIPTSHVCPVQKRIDDMFASDDPIHELQVFSKTVAPHALSQVVKYGERRFLDWMNHSAVSSSCHIRFIQSPPCFRLTQDINWILVRKQFAFVPLSENRSGIYTIEILENMNAMRFFLLTLQAGGSASIPSILMVTPSDIEGEEPCPEAVEKEMAKWLGDQSLIERMLGGVPHFEWDRYYPTPEKERGALLYYTIPPSDVA